MRSRERAFTILIVEDQRLIALNIEDVVRNLGSSAVGYAARLSDALALIETASWDMALLDLKLPEGQTTYPAAERLRAKGVPFAFLTAWDGEIDAAYSDAPVLRKPFGEAQLEGCLRMLIGKMTHPASEQGDAA
jgi:CheY-like chemotaxis protein